MEEGGNTTVQHILEEEEEEGFESVRSLSKGSTNEAATSPEREWKQQSSSSLNAPLPSSMKKPALEPYVGRLERFELFCTNQCYYLVACDKNNLTYRVLKMDRTLIEHQTELPETPSIARSMTAGDASVTSESLAETTHRAKPTLRPLSDFLTEDPHSYTQAEIQDMLDMIHHGNQFSRSNQGEGSNNSGGGLKPMAKGYGILGFIRFLDYYYLTVITKRAKVGSIGGNGIYTIKNTETFPLKPAERILTGHGGADQHTDPSSMLLNMWNRGKRSVGLGLTNREIAELRYQGLYQVVDFTKNFYFSYTYDLTRSLQENFLATTSQPFPPPPIKDMYAWNYFLTRELEECTNSLTSYHWIMPVIHGAFVQRKLNDYGRILNLALVARRSRHFAGTRYLKRGVSEQGKVANDVEHEQILHDEASSAPGGAFSSYLQVRGSIPTYWTQESSVTMPKPPIELNRVDPTYRATQAHFEDLMVRYGSPVVVLDLVKQSEKRAREVLVGNEYRHAVDYINTSIDDPHKIRYCALDYSHITKHRNLDVSTSLNEVSTWSVNQTGFFCSTPGWKILEDGHIVPFDEEDERAASFMTKQLGFPVCPMEQRGVLRTNCIDCLDRTNVAQFSAGVEALEQQLVVMGIRNSPKLDSMSTIIRVLIDMYVDIGDHIALQYGGSEAHKKVSAERSDSSIHGPIGKHKELLTSIRRYYSNAFTDRLKQDAMNLFLGYYVPYRHLVALWEMETDYWLHNSQPKPDRGAFHSMREYQRAFGVEWSDDDDEAATDSDVAQTTEPVSSALTTQRALAKIKSRRLQRKVLEHGFEPTEAKKVSRVRRRCRAQNSALSCWWKVAIQRNLQQRMWMQLGGAPAESMLPPRFERLYQPDKLSQFDKCFSRSWATPVRRSHSAQHGSEPEDETALKYKKSIRKTFPESSEVTAESKDEHVATMKDYCEKYGYASRHASSLKRFVGSHHQVRDPRYSPNRGEEKVGEPAFVAAVKDDRKPFDEFIEYTSEKSLSAIPYRQETIDEFSKCLHDTSLHSDDVAGIQKLADSAHIGSTILSGPYRGLRHDQSAIEVTTLIHEQFNALTNLSTRPGYTGGFQLVDDELRRRGFYTVGVREAVARGWEQQKLARDQFAEVVDGSNLACRRSDLTDEASLRLYSSFFGGAQPLSKPDITYMVGDQARSTGHAPTKKLAPEMKTSFVERAGKLGIPIRSHAEVKSSQSPQLFSFERDGHVPEGFEQINEDLFARKDNKFMVFNGAGVDTWRGTEATTKVLDFDSVRSTLETLGQTTMLEG